MTDRYTRTAVALHWTIAALIISAIGAGWFMTDMAISPLKLRVYSWHKWIGVTVLALFAVRALWRLTHAPPPLLPMPAWQRLAAQSLHGFLYLMMVVQPLTGWIYSNASGFPIVYLKLIPLPNLVGKDKALARAFQDYHSIGGTVLAVAIGLHALAALKHHLVDRDDTLRRMLSWRSA